ncbi:hypothetical protein C8A03DRAFT_14130, partial [Achaetomium macrosporum]
VNRKSEAQGKYHSWSISHDSRCARIYGHYARIDGSDTKYYRRAIKAFDFTVQDGKDKWTAYRFIKKFIYDFWLPGHLR